MEMSPEQVQAMLNEGWSMSVSEGREARETLDAETWAARGDRWRLPVPEQETDPAEPETHDSPLRAISWIFPAPVRAMAPTMFWTLLDRLWGVSQSDDLPMRIEVVSVEWPRGPDEPPSVAFGESDVSWGAKLLSMLLEVRDETAATMAAPTLARVDQMIANFQAQLERVAALAMTAE